METRKIKRSKNNSKNKKYKCSFFGGAHSGAAASEPDPGTPKAKFVELAGQYGTLMDQRIKLGTDTSPKYNRDLVNYVDTLIRRYVRLAHVTPAHVTSARVSYILPRDVSPEEMAYITEIMYFHVARVVECEMTTETPKVKDKDKGKGLTPDEGSMKSDSHRENLLTFYKTESGIQFINLAFVPGSKFERGYIPCLNDAENVPYLGDPSTMQSCHIDRAAFLQNGTQSGESKAAIWIGENSTGLKELSAVLLSGAGLTIGGHAKNINGIHLMNLRRDSPGLMLGLVINHAAIVHQLFKILIDRRPKPTSEPLNTALISAYLRKLTQDTASFREEAKTGAIKEVATMCIFRKLFRDVKIPRKEAGTIFSESNKIIDRIIKNPEILSGVLLDIFVKQFDTSRLGHNMSLLLEIKKFTGGKRPTTIWELVSDVVNNKFEDFIDTHIRSIENLTGVSIYSETMYKRVSDLFFTEIDRLIKAGDAEMAISEIAVREEIIGLSTKVDKLERDLAARSKNVANRNAQIERLHSAYAEVKCTLDKTQQKLDKTQKELIMKGRQLESAIAAIDELTKRQTTEEKKRSEGKKKRLDKFLNYMKGLNETMSQLREHIQFIRTNGCGLKGQISLLQIEIEIQKSELHSVEIELFFYMEEQKFVTADEEEENLTKIKDLQVRYSLQNKEFHDDEKKLKAEIRVLEGK